MPAVHTEALAGRGETCRWMSAAAGASGDRVLASSLQRVTSSLAYRLIMSSADNVSARDF